MMKFVYVVVIIDEMVEEVIRYTRDQVQEAEDMFVKRLSMHAPNFTDYTMAEVEACIEDGYEGLTQSSSIQLHWSDK